jgi:hypothetical protein
MFLIKILFIQQIEHLLYLWVNEGEFYENKV